METNLLQLLENQRKRNQETASGATKIVVSGVRDVKERSNQKDKARNRANRGVKPPRYNSTAELQDALWHAGAFQGIKNRQGKQLTYAQAVDGVNGKLTRHDVPVKSLRGNNLDYSKQYKGIYKMLIPAIIGGTYINNTNN